MIVLSYTLKNSSDLNTVYKNRAKKQLTKQASITSLQSYEAAAGSKEPESKVGRVSTVSAMREFFSVLVCLPRARWRGAKIMEAC